jgi:hypothetical protein
MRTLLCATLGIDVYTAVVTKHLLAALLFTPSFAAAAAPVSKPSPRAEFAAVVEQVKSAPGDMTLRRKAITLARALKPAPAIPEAARKAMVKGAAYQKNSKDAAGFAMAESAFAEATKLAPWWADAYYNLSVVQELRKDFPGAMASLKLFLAAAPASEVRAGQDRLYALEAAAEMAAAEKAKPDFSGRWGDDHSNKFEFNMEGGGDVGVTIILWNNASMTGRARVEGRTIRGNWAKTVTTAANMCAATFSGTLSEDNQRLDWNRRSLCDPPMEFSLVLTREK